MPLIAHLDLYDLLVNLILDLCNMMKYAMFIVGLLRERKVERLCFRIDERLPTSSWSRKNKRIENEKHIIRADKR